MREQGLRRSVRRVLGAWLGAGALATGYGIFMAWLLTGAAPTAVMWWLILPLALVVALLAAALMAVWEAAPALAAWRALRQVASDMADDLEAGWQAARQPHNVSAFDGVVTGPVVDEYPPERADQRQAA